MKYPVFATTLVIDLLLLGTVIRSWVRPTRRLWPPPGRNSWQLYWTWALVVLLCLGLAALTVLDWDSFAYSHWSRFILAALFFLLGNALAWWGVAVLSCSATAGLRNKLVTRGPYRFTRNPQYLGDIAILAGVGFFANSWLVWLIVVPAVLACLIVPLAEEVWLEEQYGEAYVEYRLKVKRFL